MTLFSRLRDGGRRSNTMVAFATVQMHWVRQGERSYSAMASCCCSLYKKHSVRCGGDAVVTYWLCSGDMVVGVRCDPTALAAVELDPGGRRVAAYHHSGATVMSQQHHSGINLFKYQKCSVRSGGDTEVMYW